MHHADPLVQQVAKVSAISEGEGYCEWSRIQEICKFARMGFRNVRIATCISFVDLLRLFSAILKSIYHNAVLHAALPRRGHALPLSASNGCARPVHPQLG